MMMWSGWAPHGLKRIESEICKIIRRDKTLEKDPNKRCFWYDSKRNLIQEILESPLENYIIQNLIENALNYGWEQRKIETY